MVLGHDVHVDTLQSIGSKHFREELRLYKTETERYELYAQKRDDLLAQEDNLKILLAVYVLEWVMAPTRIRDGLCNRRGEPTYACVSNPCKSICSFRHVGLSIPQYSYMEGLAPTP